MARTDFFFGKSSQVGSLRWPDPEQGPWLVQIAWRDVDGLPIPVGMILRQVESDGGSKKVDGQVLRQLPFARLAQRTRAQLIEGNSKSAAWWGTAANTAANADARAEAEREAQDSRSFVESLDVSVRPRFYDDNHYGEVARIYRANSHPGGKPTKAVQDALHLSKSAAAKQVARARARGLLEPSSGRGRKA